MYRDILTAIIAHLQTEDTGDKDHTVRVLGLVLKSVVGLPEYSVVLRSLAVAGEGEWSSALANHLSSPELLLLG